MLLIVIRIYSWKTQYVDIALKFSNDKCRILKAKIGNELSTNGEFRDLVTGKYVFLKILFKFCIFLTPSVQASYLQLFSFFSFFFSEIN